MTSSASDPARYKFLHDPIVLSKRHLQFGWWTLLAFVVLGLVLESLHGFKSGAFLGATDEAQRRMWTLAHAHGTLFGVLNVLFALSVRLLPEWAARERGLASASLRGATLLTPAGFFLGSVRLYLGDPGVGLLLVPVGAVLAILAVFLIACGTGSIRLRARENHQGGGAASGQFQRGYRPSNVQGEPTRTQ